MDGLGAAVGRLGSLDETQRVVVRLSRIRSYTEGGAHGAEARAALALGLEVGCPRVHSKPHRVS